MCASVYQRWAERVSPLQPHENPQKEAKFSKFLLFPKPSTSLSDGVQWLLCFCRACFLTFGRRSEVLRHDHSLIWGVRLVQREGQRSRAGGGRMSILWPLSVNLESTEQLHSALTINYQARSADPVTARRVARYSPCSPKTPERSSASYVSTTANGSPRRTSMMATYWEIYSPPPSSSLKTCYRRKRCRSATS